MGRPGGGGSGGYERGRREGDVARIDAPALTRQGSEAVTCKGRGGGASPKGREWKQVRRGGVAGTGTSRQEPARRHAFHSRIPTNAVDTAL